jgi:hypothetical protein
MTALIILGIIGFILLIGVVLGLVPAAAFVYIWRSIYPWLVRMGRWAAQLRNLIFLFFALLVIDIVLGFIVRLLTGSTGLGILILLISLAVFLFFLLLAIVVWLVRLWRWGYRPSRAAFWVIFFRILGGLGTIVMWIPRAIGWVLYHPPISWIVAILLFYIRAFAAIAAWLLYHPPLRWLIITAFLCIRLIARVVASLLYDPPLHWLVETRLFLVRLVGWIIVLCLFCLRPIMAVIAWLLYHPPLRWLATIAVLFVGLISRVVAWLLYHPPLRWLERAGLSGLGLAASVAGTVIYAPLPLLLKVAHSTRETARGIAAVIARLLSHRPLRWLVAAVLFLIRLITSVVAWVIYGLLSLLFKLFHRIREAMGTSLAGNANPHNQYDYANNAHCSAT